MDNLRQLLDGIFRLKLNYKQRAILLAYADEADPETGQVTASVARIAWKVDASDSTVRRCIKVLIADGILVIVRPSRGRIPSTFGFCFDVSKRKQPCQLSDRVDYTQPSQLSDRVEGVTQPSQLSDRVGATRQVEHNRDRVNLVNTSDRVGAPYLQSTILLVDCRLLIEGWVAGHPDGQKPRYTHTQENIALATELASEGFTVEDVVKLTSEKMNSRTGQYKFKWLAEDLRSQRRAKEALQVKRKPIKPVEEIIEMTPEQRERRLAIIAQARKEQGFERKPKDDRHVA